MVYANRRLGDLNRYAVDLNQSGRTLIMDNSVSRKRRVVTICSLFLGTTGFVIGGLFAVAGAGMYGSPFQGGSYFNNTLMLILVFGPFAILPCAIFDIWKPGLGGLALCASSIIDVVVIILNNWTEYGFSVYNSAGASTFVALPIFVVGSLLYYSSQSTRAWNIWIWRGLLALLVIAFLFFAWKIAPDHWFFIKRLFEGNSNPPEI